jgi:uncharacterized protein with PIN domain
MSRRLLLDSMLGKLATYLRMCGYDAAYALDDGLDDDGAVLARLRESGRTLVTRDRRLAAAADGSVLLTERAIDDQLREFTAAGYSLELADEPARCGVCNSSLERVEPTERTPAYAPDSAEVPVYRCIECGKHFWRGSHWKDVAETLEGL